MLNRNTNQSYSALYFGAGFLILAGLFHWADPYKTLFFTNAKLPHMAHITGRLLFCGYFFAILFGLGQLPLRLFGKDFELTAGEELAVSVLCGSAILRIAMLALGFASLYKWGLLVGLGTCASVFAWPRLQVLMRSGMSYLQSIVRFSSVEGIITVALLLVLLAASLQIISGKFLFPNGTGDFYSHYFPYYKHVIQAQNIWPNEVWYHFYVSKGAGDVFYAMIASDLLGMNVVSCVMFFTSLILMFSMVLHMSGDSLCALAVAALAAIGMMWTFETKIGFTHWAEFPKQHVITAVLFLGCVYAVWRQNFTEKENALAWGCITALMFAGLIILRPQFGLLCLIFLGLMAGINLCLKRYQSFSANVLCMGVVAFTVVGLLALNYWITGLAEVTPFRFFWRYADQAKFAEWVSPFMMLLLDLGSSPDLGSIAPPNFQQFPLAKLLVAVFRLDKSMLVVYPYGIPLVLLMLWSVHSIRQYRQTNHFNVLRNMAIFLVMLAAASLVFLSVNQIGSLYRLYMFCVFPVIALTVLPFIFARQVSTEGVRVLVGVLLVILVIGAFKREYKLIPPERRHAEHQFLKGRLNIAEAFEMQHAVWQGALQMAEQIPANEAIWTTQISRHFCMAPQCNLKTFFSFSMNKDWANIMFQSPEIAKAALQQQGLNYFALDTNDLAFDLLPYSPLFSPSNINKYLGMVWSKDGVYLLTWKSEKTAELPPEFIVQYRHSMELALQSADFPMLYQRLNEIYQQWNLEKRWPVAIDPALPRVRGWQ